MLQVKHLSSIPISHGRKNPEIGMVLLSELEGIVVEESDLTIEESNKVFFDISGVVYLDIDVVDI